MSISENLKQIKSTLPAGVTLVAVSKFHPVEALREAYDTGQRIFGESREQELKMKHEALPQDIEWHFIGHLQTNKVKYIAPFVALIHSVDTERLLDEIDRQALKNDRTIDVLLQIHIAQESTKTGFTPAEVTALLQDTDVATRWPHIRLRGLMGMATYTDDEAQIRREFRQLTALHRALIEGPLKQQLATGHPFDILSFGMSEDYPIAIEEGSTMVRIGTSIFGEREYTK